MTSAAQVSALPSIREWIATALGLRFDVEQSVNLDSRIDGACRRLGVSLETLLVRLHAGDHATATCVAEEVSTNHTYFFREPEMFTFLEQSIVPSLPRRGELRVWSAACSSGEEAFSLAISLTGALGGIEARERVRILGTDLSARQILRAENGHYLRRQVTSLDEQQSRFFTPAADDSVRVREDIAAMCTFRRVNLTTFPWPFQHRFHVIFLRNVLYYFDPAMRRRVLAACSRVIEPGGWLVTSLTEPMADQPPGWAQWQPGVYRRESGA